jgi:hypothetical protein
MGIVNKKEQTMTTAIYADLTPQEKWQIGAFGATEAQVQECITEYLGRKSSWRVVVDMLNSAWVRANEADFEEARQTLNRVKLAIDRFYCADEPDFFQTQPGRAYSILSDAQELLAMEDIRGAQMCIDEAVTLIMTHEEVR